MHNICQFFCVIDKSIGVDKDFESMDRKIVAGQSCHEASYENVLKIFVASNLIPDMGGAQDVKEPGKRNVLVCLKLSLRSWANCCWSINRGEYFEFMGLCITHMDEITVTSDLNFILKSTSGELRRDSLSGKSFEDKIVPR